MLHCREFRLMIVREVKISNKARLHRHCQAPTWPGVVESSSPTGLSNKTSIARPECWCVCRVRAYSLTHTVVVGDALFSPFFLDFALIWSWHAKGEGEYTHDRALEVEPRIMVVWLHDCTTAVVGGLPSRVVSKRGRWHPNVRWLPGFRPF